MPIANAQFYNGYSNLSSIVAANITPLVAPSMFKATNVAFKAGQLLARDLNGNVIAFTWETAGTATHQFAGVCMYDVDTASTDVRVITAGDLRVSQLRFTTVKTEAGAASNFTLAKLLTLFNVRGNVYDEFTFQGEAVLKLIATTGQFTATESPTN